MSREPGSSARRSPEGRVSPASAARTCAYAVRAPRPASRQAVPGGGFFAGERLRYTAAPLIPPHRKSPFVPASRAGRLPLALLLLGLAGCGSGASSPAPAALTYSGSGTLSDTVLPPLSELFVRRGGRALSYEGYVGSSEGFKQVMEGKVMLAGLARSLKSAEKAQHPYYVIIGYDALAVYVHPDNPVATLSRAQLKALFTGTLRNWREVGGANAPVELVTIRLTTGAGTADFFREQILEGAAFAPTRVIPHPRDVMAYVAAHPHAIAFGTLSVPAQGVRFLPVEGVAPTADSVRTADYLLSRPLLLATRDVPEGDLQAFLDLAMSPEGQALVSRSFVPVHVAR
jgi:phosphate transport system substrate-binding protein